MKSSILAKGISVTSPRHLLCWKAPAVLEGTSRGDTVVAGHCSGAGGHHHSTLGCARPCGSTLPPRPSLGSRDLPLPGGDPHHPQIWVSPLPCRCCSTPQHRQWAGGVGGPSCCTSRLQCSPQQLPAGTRGSTPLEKPKSPMWERTLDLRGKATALPVQCQRLLSSLRRAQGPEPGDSQRCGDGEPFPPPSPDGEGPRGFLFNAML